MAIELIAKIKQKNNGVFFLVDCEDVEMPAELGGGSLVDYLLKWSGTVAKDGVTYIPTIDSDGILTWARSDGAEENIPEAVRVKGEDGAGLEFYWAGDAPGEKRRLGVRVKGSDDAWAYSDDLQGMQGEDVKVAEWSDNDVANAIYRLVFTLPSGEEILTPNLMGTTVEKPDKYTTWGAQVARGDTELVVATTKPCDADMTECFAECSNLTNVCHLDVSEVTSLNGTFRDCPSLMGVSLSKAPALSDMTETFKNCKAMTFVSLNHLVDTLGDDLPVTSVKGMFSGCSALRAVAMDRLGLGIVTDASEMFDGCVSLTELDADCWSLRSVRDVTRMFNGCDMLKRVKLNGCNFRSLEVAPTEMFNGCITLEELTANAWVLNDTFQTMLYGATALVTLSLQGLGCPSVTVPIVKNLSSLKYLDCTASNVSLNSPLIQSCDSLESVKLQELIILGINSPIISDCAALREIDASNSKNLSLSRNVVFLSGLPNLEYFNISKSTFIGRLPSSSPFFPGTVRKKVDMKNCHFPGLISVNNNLLYWDTPELDASGWDMPNAIGISSGTFANLSADTVLDVSNWNMPLVQTASTAFRGCKVKRLDLSTWGLSSLENAQGMFQSCRSEEIKTSGWDLSKLVDASQMFADCSATEIDASTWGLSSLENAQGMFQSSKIKKINTSGWNLSNLRNAVYMFHNTPLESIDASSWAFGSLTNITEAFANCTSLKEVKAGGWNLTNVGGLAIFGGCTALERLEAQNWNLSGLTGGDLSRILGFANIPYIDATDWNLCDLQSAEMFCSWLSKSETLIITGWNLSSCTSTRLMCAGCSFKKIEAEGLDLSSCTDAAGMFTEDPFVESILANYWRLGSLQHIDHMFYSDTNLRSLEVAGWDLRRLESAEEVFGECPLLTEIHASGWMLSDVYPKLPYSLEYTEADEWEVEGPGGLAIFKDLPLFRSFEASYWNIGNVTSADFAEMFDSCPLLRSLTLYSWNISGVETLDNLFIKATALEYLDMSYWYLPELASAASLFEGRTALQYVSLSNWTTIISSYANMFKGCTALTSVDCSYISHADQIESLSCMFDGCTSLEEVDFYRTLFGLVHDASHMFRGCTSLTEMSLPGYAEHAAGMFDGCSALISVSLTDPGNESMTTAQRLFRGCSSLVDVGYLCFSGRTDYETDHADSPFCGCGELVDMSIIGMIYQRFDVLDCPKLSADSLHSIVEALYDYTTNTDGEEIADGFVPTILLHADSIAVLNESGDYQTIVDKGWLIAEE